MKALDKHLLHQFHGSTQSLFMEQFVKGMKAQMSKEKNRDKPLVSEVVAPLLDRIEEEIYLPSTNPARKRELIMAGGYIAVTFGYLLRGNKGFWVDGKQLVEGLSLGAKANKDPHIVLSHFLASSKARKGTGCT